MNVASFSVRRPVFTVMATLIVIILGGVSLSRLPVDLMPDITYPTLSVSTGYENASPEEIEELITRPVEEAMSAIPGVEEVSSISSEGNSNVRVTFVWGTDLGEASNDIRDRLDRVKSRLPEDADTPSLRKFDIASFPILFLGASSRLDPVQMRQLIDEQVKYRIERVDGVAALDVWGGLEREIHVNVDEDKLKALGLSLEQVIQEIRSANITLPAGIVEAGNYELTLRTPGEYKSIDQLRNTTIAVKGETPIRLGEVAHVEDRWQRITRVVRVNGEPGIRLAVSKRSGTNTVEVARRVLREIEQINQDIPQIHLIPVVDTSEYIQRSIRNVSSAALFGGVFAVVILLVFLRNARSTAIISAAIPVSVVATFALIYFGGFTLNIMTLGGLALGIGMLVDNSIVVLENIYRLRETDLEAREAAIKGARDVTPAIVASTLTTLAVFLPIVFVRGMAGVMFQQLAFVVAFSLLCSLGVALTLIPMLASRFLQPTSLDRVNHESIRHRIFRVSGLAFSRIENEYKSLLHVALNNRGLVIIISLACLAGSLMLVPFVGTELMPQGDEGEVDIDVEMEVGTRLEIMDRTLRPMEEVIREKVPELENTITSAGGSPWRGTGSHTGDIRIALKPQAERERSSEDVAAALRREFSDIPGATVRVRAGQGLFLLRRIAGGSERVEVEVRGFDLETADALSREVAAVVEAVDGVTDTRISRDTGTPERLIMIDRTKAEAMNVRVRQVADMLQTAVSGTRAGEYREGGDEFAIRVMIEDAEQKSLRELLDLTVTNSQGEPVVLRNIVSVEPRSGPVRIERNNQERVITVRANIQDRDMGAIIGDIRRGLQRIPVPRGFHIGFSGDYEEQQEAFGELQLGFILALVLVYMVMACLYESLRDPFVVMFSVPLAAIGVVLMLFLTETTFNMQSYIGCIMLGGIVVNNAILLVDSTNQLRNEGMALRQAVEEAGRRRLRPILMTALTTICGLIPLALGIGEGGEAQAPLARAVIGGLASSTLITLVFVPGVYSIFERKRPGGEMGAAAPTAPGETAP